MGSGALQITISLFAILGAAGLALVCDYLRHRNEELKAAMVAMRNGQSVVARSAPKTAQASPEQIQTKTTPQPAQAAQAEDTAAVVHHEVRVEDAIAETLAEAADANAVQPSTQSRRPRRRRPVEAEVAEVGRNGVRREGEAARVAFIERAMSVAAELASHREEVVVNGAVAEAAVVTKEEPKSSVVPVMQQMSTDGAMKDWLSRRATAKMASWESSLGATVAAPAVSETMVSEPVVAETVVTSPAVSEPVVPAPVVSPPVVAAPVVDLPVAAAPAVSTPVVLTPVVSESAIAAAIVPSPVAAAPTASESVVVTPVAAAPAVSETVVTEPVAAEVVVTEAAVPAPVVIAPVVAAAPAVSETVVTEPVVAEAVVTEAAVPAPVVPEPVVIASATPALAAPVVAAPVVTLVPAPVVSVLAVAAPVSESALNAPEPAAIHVDQKIWSSAFPDEPKLMLVNRSESAGAKVPQAGRQASDAVAPVGVQDGMILARLLAGSQPYTGVVICISVKDMDERVINNKVISFLTELARPSDVLCRASKDEFVLLCPDERGSDSRRRLGSISQQLWDYQLRNLSNFSVQFSWGSEDAWRAKLSDALEAARDNMAASRRTREMGKPPRRKAV